MLKKVKGKDVKVMANGAVIAKSTSCTVNLKVNTSESASKDDEDGEFDNPEVQSTSWEFSNESFASDKTQIKNLMEAWLAGTSVTTTISIGTLPKPWSGKGYITSLSILAPKEGNATVKMSVSGDGPLTIM